MVIFAEVSGNKFIRERHPVKSDNLNNTVQYLANGVR